MTKKPIMIDDVDVLNCGHFSQFEGETENACYIQPIRVIGSDVKIGFGSCNLSPNCYYKQLKRKEEECERLKEQLDSISREAEDFDYEVQEIFTEKTNLEIELKELNQQLDQLKADSETYKYQWEKQYELCEYWHSQAEKYKQKLQEIFKCLIMANRANKITDTLWTDNSTTLWDYIAQTLGLEGDQLEIEEQILQKCEVIDQCKTQ